MVCGPVAQGPALAGRPSSLSPTSSTAPQVSHQVRPSQVPTWCPWYPDKISRARPSTHSKTHVRQTNLDKERTSSTRQAQGSQAHVTAQGSSSVGGRGWTLRCLPCVGAATSLSPAWAPHDTDAGDTIGAFCTDRCCAPRCLWCPCGARARPQKAGKAVRPARGDIDTHR